MGEFHFLRPYWLLTVLPALVLCWRIFREQDRVDKWKQVVDPHLLEHLLVGERKRQRLRPINLLPILWLVSAVALAGPTWRREPSPFADDEAGLVVLLKVSGTMNATDVQPSRLERAKHKLRDLLELRAGVSTGLIVYSGSAHLVMPLTRDDRIISAMVNDLTPELMPVDGDALAQALGLAEDLLQKASVPGSVLVMADAVAPSQIQALSVAETKLPVQILALQSPSAPVDSGLQNAASALHAPIVRLTVDQTDVARVAQRARSEFRMAAAADGGEQWHDAGRALLPLIALCTLVWSRKGWVVR
ncbi:MAG: VWA domain-containing protein [Phycisphaerales bacterium]|nr:MAG: VWA domain-containing protein [Phycisphaerales bacterium]